VDPFPDEFGAQNSIISKLDQYELVLKISSQSVHNFLSYCTHKQSITIHYPWTLSWIVKTPFTWLAVAVGLLFSFDMIWYERRVTWTQKPSYQL